ncbi:MAG: RNA polymerase sigma factor [Marinicaulis sp.]|nr:RNA polymerase sigma factor [Marinicaulis sp.]
MKDAETATIELFRERRLVFLRVLMRRLGNLEEAEEVLQEAFINFDRAAKKETISNPDGYLMKIALNLAVDRIRKDASRRRREDSWFDANSAGRIGAQYIAAAPQQDQALIAKQEMAQLAACLEELSENVRGAFILHKVKGLPHSETAEILGLSQSTVEKHIMKAMRHVTANMAED